MVERESQLPESYIDPALSRIAEVADAIGHLVPVVEFELSGFALNPDKLDDDKRGKLQTFDKHLERIAHIRETLHQSISALVGNEEETSASQLETADIGQEEPVPKATKPLAGSELEPQTPTQAPTAPTEPRRRYIPAREASREKPTAKLLPGAEIPYTKPVGKDLAFTVEILENTIIGTAGKAIGLRTNAEVEILSTLARNRKEPPMAPSTIRSRISSMRLNPKEFTEAIKALQERLNSDNKLILKTGNKRSVRYRINPNATFHDKRSEAELAAENTSIDTPDMVDLDDLANRHEATATDVKKN